MKLSLLSLIVAQNNYLYGQQVFKLPLYPLNSIFYNYRVLFHMSMYIYNTNFKHAISKFHNLYLDTFLSSQFASIKDLFTFLIFSLFFRHFSYFYLFIRFFNLLFGISKVHISSFTINIKSWTFVFTCLNLHIYALQDFMRILNCISFMSYYLKYLQVIAFE